MRHAEAPPYKNDSVITVLGLVTGKYISLKGVVLCFMVIFTMGPIPQIPIADFTNTLVTVWFYKVELNWLFSHSLVLYLFNSKILNLMSWYIFELTAHEINHKD